MHIKHLISAAAITMALSVGMGAAYAGERFSALEEVQAGSLSLSEMARVRGAFIIFIDRDRDGLFDLVGRLAPPILPCPTALSCPVQDFPLEPDGLVTIVCGPGECFAPQH